MGSTQEAPDTESRWKTAASSFEGQIKAEDVKHMVEDVRESFATEKTYSKEWRKGQLKAFEKMLVECEQEFCEALLTDLHKSPYEGKLTELNLIKSEIHTCLANLDKWMKPVKKKPVGLNAPSWNSTQRDPLGVVLVLGAWNYPIQLSLLPMVGAIAAGNCVIMKPGSYSKASSNVMARIVNRYLDPECIRVVEGNRQVTNALLKEKFDKIFFTGSAFVGRIVARAAAEHLTPVVLELGGKSPVIVDSSAHVKHAAERIVWGAFLNGGQTCVRPDFLMVHEKVADQFFEEFQKAVTKFYGENPQETEFFGRCVNDEACKRLAGLIETHKDRIVFGGKVDPADKYISPTLLDFGSGVEQFRHAEIMQDEIFGPVFPAVRYSKTDDVINFIKRLKTGKPLAVYAFGQNTKFIQSIKTRTTSGGLCINDVIMNLIDHNLPFGGVGNSGMGSYHGKYSYDCFTHEKPVVEKSAVIDSSVLFKPAVSARFPPYTNGKKRVIKHVANPKLEPVLSRLPKLVPKMVGRRKYKAEDHQHLKTISV